MLVLYDSTTTSFSNLGLGVLKDFYTNPIITEVLNAEYNLEFEYANNGWLSEKLLKGNIIKANGQLFRIWDIKQDLNTTKILAKHIFFDLSKNFLEDVAPTNLSATNALNWILSRTQSSHQFIINGDCSNVASARYVRKNPIDAIYNEANSILKKFGGEIELDNFNVFLHQKRGKNLGFSIRYGKNLSGVKVEMDFSSIATRIMPQGKNELLIDEKYIDSPLINNYFAPFYKKVDFNDIGIDEENGIDEEQAKNKLKEATLELFKNDIDKPKISIKINFIELSKTIEYKKYTNLETVSIGDTIKAIIPSLHLNIETRVVKTEFDCLLGRIIKIELGSVTPNIVTSQSQSNKNLNNEINKINPTSILKQAKDSATNLINHPFGGNIYISKKTGELFLMDTDDPNTAVNIWKWGIGGLGFSSKGINGPYNVAMTQDGSIVADFISTGTLSANRIEGYNNLLLTVDKIVNLYKTITGTGSITLENAHEGLMHKLTIKGNISLIYPNNILFPSSNLYPKSFQLQIDETVYDLDIDCLNYINPNICDEFVYEDGNCYIIRRVGIDENGEMYQLTNEVIEQRENVLINVLENSRITLIEFGNAILTVEYLLKNQYTDVFATEAYVDSEIKTTADEINLKVAKKVNEDEVVSKINLSPEQVLLKGNRVIIESDNFNLDANGKIIATAGEIGGFDMNSKSFSKELSGLYNYNQFDAILTGMSILKRISTDNNLSQILDINNDNNVNSIDYVNIKNTLNGTVENKKTLNGSFEINSFDPKNCISIKDEFGEIITSLGLGGVNSTYVTCNNFVCGYPSDKVDDFIGVSINGATGIISCVSLSQTSQEKYKKNFEKLENALYIVKNTDIYKYNLKTEEDISKRHIGFVIGDNYKYSEEITSTNNDGVDLYSMVSVCFKAIQEQQEQIEILKKEINQLKEMVK